ncbi:puromycin-sensitive aminopeptidase-like protein isoform X5 [Leptopilina boulardi]|uniref:puromycin-sensitive aminopeptidase-like protein isoform X5 n=1 Tax=Leptopilina boulardi TaxID=63433 RepID=UPI0021F67F32|nr:puromycin-sensitive aminopeptidase-like protein isoform X5 [Leptopilina boulardi]
MLSTNLYVFGIFLISNLAIFAQSDEYRLPNNVKPLTYKLFLNPDLSAENGTFEGSVSILIDIISTTNNLTLHASKLTIDTSQTILKSKKNQFIPVNHTLDEDHEFLIINFENDLHRGQYELNLSFHGDFNSNSETGFYKNSYIDENNHTTYFAATHFEPTFARRAFPCWDEPALKASFKIAIKHYSNYTALSNMPAIKDKPIHMDNGKIWTKFEKTPLLSTYTVAFTVSDFKEITNQHKNFSIWTRRNVADDLIEYGFKVAVDAMKSFENFTNIPYSLPKMDIFLVEDFFIAGMENWGLILLKEFYFLSNNETNELKLIDIGKKICHEIIHQWIGNLVSPAWWSDLWITEGLPNYYETLVFDKMGVQENTETEIFYRKLRGSFLLEEDRTCQPLHQKINDASNIFHDITTLYFKSQIIFNMLASIISRQVLNKGIKKILKEYQFSTISTDQFFETIQESVNNSTYLRGKYDSLDVKSLIMPYITQVGYPVIDVFRDNATGIIKLTQKCYVCEENNSTDLKWPIPITYTTESLLEFNFSQTMNLFTPSMNELIINNVSMNDWIIFNIQQNGYYRVNYDETTWQQIIDFMNSKKYSKIHVKNRLRILDDAGWFYLKGKLSKENFYKLLSYCIREKSFLIWNMLIEIVAKIMLYMKDNMLDFYKNIVDTIVKKKLFIEGDRRLLRIKDNLRFLNYCHNKTELCKTIF